jgi:hypothetical protein
MPAVLMTMKMHKTLIAAMTTLALSSPALAQTRGPDAEVLKRRYQIKVMEGVLQGAVRHGADVLNAQLRPINPNLVLLTGMARARGTILESYGVFFDVEIPALRESVAWSIRTMALQPDPMLIQSLEQLKRQVAAVQDADARATLQRNIAEIEQRMGFAANAAGAAAGGPGPARRVSNSGAMEIAQTAPAAGTAAPVLLNDPNEMYTRAVKDALVDAMLDHSGPMNIAPDEWLTVAARDAQGPLGPGEPYDAFTLVLRIRGSDLAAFRAGRLTRDEAREQVEAREF